MKGLALLLLSLAASAQSTVATWTLVEPAGVAHPSQPVCFPYSGGALRYESNRVLGPASTEVVWQQLRDGSVCVVASLVANDTGDTYTLQSGAPTTVTSASSVALVKTADYLQVSNGLSGVRLPTPAAQAAASPAYALAPISKVLVDGSWIGDTPYLYEGILHQVGTGQSAGVVVFCTAVSQAIREAGPIQVTVVTSISCNRPEYKYGSTVLRVAGDGFFTSEVTVYAGSKSVVFSYYTDLDINWKLDISAAYSVLPNLLAWRGHSTGSVLCGYYLPDGVTKTSYPAAHSRGEMQALMDVSYATAKTPRPYGGCTSKNPGMLANYIASGGDIAFAQWMLNDAEGGSYPVVGMWTGAGGKQIAQISNSGFYTAPAGIYLYHETTLFGSNAGETTEVGAEYGYFFDVQSSLPLKTEYSVRPSAILNEMNGLRGPLKLTKLYANSLDYADPPGGYEWPFLEDATMDAAVARINSTTAYYNALIASEPGTEGAKFVDWARYQDDTRRTAILTAGATIKSSIEKWVLGDGRFDRNEHYYQGLYQFIRNIDNFHALIKDSGSSAGEVLEAKRWLGLGVSLANDADYFKYENRSCPDGCGNENQIYQHVVFRNLLALVMPYHPSVKQDVLARATASLEPLLTNYWNDSGAGKASTVYQSNYAEPAVAVMLAAIKKGVLSSPSAYTKLRDSINWDLSSLTPPEPRFYNRRKAYSNGDGNTGAVSRLGVLGSAFAATSPTVSSNAIWGWRSQDTAARYTHGSFYFPTVGMVDDQITQVDPAIGSLYMAGYHAALRTGWETVNETAAWFIHGGWYSDHKHRDNGQVSIYANKAPLSIDWNANLYYPQTPGGYMHSKAIRESELSVAWDGTMTSYNVPNTEWGTAASTEFGKFQYGSFSKSTFGTTWTRDVRMLSHAASYPIIIVRDSFSGADASVSKIVSSMHMATGAVTVNGGDVTPTTRNYDSGAQFPSCTAGAALLSGLNRLQFTGQTWTQHATSGIDWDAYVNVSSAADYCLGNWSHVEHSSREKSEYATANGGSFRERQHILRVKTSDSALETVLLPWRKGESTTFTVTNEACGTQIVRGTHTTCSSEDKVQWTDGTDVSLMATGTASVSYSNLTLSGGPGEVRSSGSDYVAIVDGLSAQNRTITLPAGTWYPNAAAVTVAGNQFRLFHDGTTGQPRSVTFSGSASGGSISLGFSPPSGGASVRVYIDGFAVAQEACASTCSFELQLPSGTFDLKHAWVDASGSVFLTSTEKSITI